MIIVKITKKGQITIPAKFREKLATNIVQIEMEGEKIVIKPIRKPGGMLEKYAFKDKPIEVIMQLEKEVIENAFREKHSHR